ncbi:hypothetical protein BKI52_32365 [marine bacterium AO1-C]|nr:hypothetical protein BKI52_32365 [marine bacterium AO1-C]
MKNQIKQIVLWAMILLLNVSWAYADAPPVKQVKVLSKKESRLQRRLERRQARKLKRQERKVKRAKRFLNSRLGKWIFKKVIRKAVKQREKRARKTKDTVKVGLILLAIGGGLLLTVLLIAAGGSFGFSGGIVLALLWFLGLASLIVSGVAFIIALLV